MEKLVVVCDLDSDDRPATTSLDIRLDGQHWVLDLCDEHVAKVRAVLDPLLTVVRPVPDVAGPGDEEPDGHGGRRPGSRRWHAEERARIRSWSRERGLAVNERGRLPREVVEAYHREARKRAG